MDQFETHDEFGEDEEEYEMSDASSEAESGSYNSDESGSSGSGKDDEYGGAEDGDGSDGSDKVQKAPRLKPNLALADAMEKILHQTVGNEIAILAKSKTAEKRLEKEKLDARERRKRLAEKRRVMELGRVYPDVLKIDKERKLVKVATRGVVKLFNAVAKQQKQTGTSGAKTSSATQSKAAVGALSKENFLNMLKAHED